MSSGAISKLLDDFQSRFSEHINGMKACSFDSSFNKNVGFVLVDSDYKCYNFDDIQGAICEQNGYEKLQSSDAILPLDSSSGNSKLYLIEFKNNRASSDKNRGIIPYSEVRAKILNSLLFFRRFYKMTDDDFKNIITITVKYNSIKKKKNLANMRKHFGLKIGSEKDEVENFKILKDEYGIISYKFDSSDFIAFLEENNLAIN